MSQEEEHTREGSDEDEDEGRRETDCKKMKMLQRSRRGCKERWRMKKTQKKRLQPKSNGRCSD